MEVLIGLIGVAIGIAGSFIFTKIQSHKKVVGVLRVDHSDPEEAPYLFLELKQSTAVATIMKSKQVVFDVKVENYLTPRK